MEFFKQKGKEGGLKRAANMTKKELSDAGRRAVKARWARAKKAAAASAKVRSAKAKARAKKGK